MGFMHRADNLLLPECTPDLQESLGVNVKGFEALCHPLLPSQILHQI